MKPQFQHSRAHQFREPSLQLGYLADDVVGVFAGDPADELPGAGAHQDGVVVALSRLNAHVTLVSSLSSTSPKGMP